MLARSGQARPRRSGATRAVPASHDHHSSDPSRSRNPPVCSPKCSADDDARQAQGSDDDPPIDQPGRPALPLHRLGGVEARSSAGARPARVRDAPRGGLRARQAAWHGLRDDHRSRHDRRRARARRALRRRVRLRGADRLISRRAPSRAHPLLGDHARRPRAPAGAVGRRRGGRQRAARALDRVRARAPVLRRRGAAAAAPPPPPRTALPDLGDAQRLARPRAQRARGRLRRHARRHRRRRLRRPRRRRHRPHVHRDA